MTKILIIGAKGQIGTELTATLRDCYGHLSVIAADLNMTDKDVDSLNVRLNVLDKVALHSLVIERKITIIYHLAAILSVMGEKFPLRTWDLNIQGLLNVLDVAKTERLKVFWPSSIAVFGANASKAFCPQHSVTQPYTVYGISKAAGENWCAYYQEQYGVDVRSIRFPGLISHRAKPGGGTTDYAVDIFREAVDRRQYTCYLKEFMYLPMLYMPDAIRAIMELMDAPLDKLTVKTAYNLSGMSFSPLELANTIKVFLPGFQIHFRPDARQKIAETWPSSVDDRHARHDWGWQPQYDLPAMTLDMLTQLKNLPAG